MAAWFRRLPLDQMVLSSITGSSLTLVQLSLRGLNHAVTYKLMEFISFVLLPRRSEESLNPVNRLNRAGSLKRQCMANVNNSNVYIYKPINR